MQAFCFRAINREERDERKDEEDVVDEGAIFVFLPLCHTFSDRRSASTSA